MKLKIDGKVYTLTQRADRRIEVRGRDAHAVLPAGITFQTPNLKLIVKMSLKAHSLTSTEN